MAIYRVQRQFGLALDVSNIPGVPESMKSPTVAGAGSGASTVAGNATIPFKPAATGTNVENLKNTKEVFKNGQNSVGLKQGALNTWKNIGNSKFGTAKQAGIIGTGVLGAGLLAKGLMGGSKKEAAFSEDTGAALKEAALYGGTLATGIGGVVLAKKGKLGFTKSQRAGNKEAYEKVVKNVKSIWNETAQKGKEVVKETKTTKAPGEEPRTVSRTVVKTTNPRYNKEDWKKIKNYLKEKGLNFRNQEDILGAAKSLGIKPV